jgi:hypothetical protein
MKGHQRSYVSEPALKGKTEDVKDNFEGEIICIPTLISLMFAYGLLELPDNPTYVVLRISFSLHYSGS